MNQFMKLENQYGAHNYAPLPVMLVKGKGCYVWDEKGKKYIDMMGAYSAVSHGHCHPQLIKVVQQQSKQLNVVSRAYYTSKLGPFLEKACKITGMARALPMNTGAEAVETAIKAARRWGYRVKKVPANKAEIIVCQENFHGRTTTITGFASSKKYQDGFGPFTPGFKMIPFGDIKALEKAITKNTVAFLVEPIQGEGGINVPPKGFLKKASLLCKKKKILLIADEIQCGLARTGKVLACAHDGVKPDGLILGKALGGGILPVSMFLARKDVMDVFDAGSHGSTFGGNPLAAAVGAAALDIMVKDDYAKRAQVLGQYFVDQLCEISSPLIQDVRGKGLFIGVEINPKHATAREVCLRMLKEGVLSKETRDTVIRCAPPLVIKKYQIDAAVDVFKKVLNSF